MQHQTLRRRVSVFLAVVFFTVCLLMVSFVIALKVSTSKTEYAYKDRAEQEDFDNESFEHKGKWYGLCAKNSIHSVDDFRTTVSKDQVLKAHYADFRWEHAKMGKLEKAMLAHVYFRKDNKIFLTKKPIKLPAGDEYITDGYTRVRTYCCNNYTLGPPPYESSDLLAEFSTGPPFYWSPDLLSEPFEDPLALKFPEQTLLFSPFSMQVALAPPLEENMLKHLEEKPFFDSISKEYGYGETTIASLPEESPFSDFVPNEYGGTAIVPQRYPTPTNPGGGGDGGGGGGGGDGGGGGEATPIPEAATILLVGVGVAVSFLVLFIGNYRTRKHKTPGHRI